MFYESPRPNGIVLVHDLSNSNSLDHLRSWHAEACLGDGSAGSSQEAALNGAGARRCPVLIVGTKLDLVSRGAGGVLPTAAGGPAAKLAAELGAGAHISVNCRDPGAFRPGTAAAAAIAGFFDKAAAHLRGTGGGPGSLTGAVLRRNNGGGLGSGLTNRGGVGT